MTDGITVTINYDEGDPECNHDWKESQLLFIRVCQKCRRIEPLNKEEVEG